MRWYPYWSQFYKVVICYCSYTQAVQLIREIFSLDISFICWLRVIRVFYVLWSLHRGRSWWTRRQGVRKIPQQLMYTLWGLSEHVPGICLFHWCSVFLVKSKTSSLGTTIQKCHIIRISKFLNIRLKQFCCTSTTQVMTLHSNRWLPMLEQNTLAPSSRLL